jgi:hypothetical protein
MRLRQDGYGDELEIKYMKYIFGRQQSGCGTKPDYFAMTSSRTNILAQARSTNSGVMR